MAGGRSVGVQAAAVSGNVTLGGTITVQGRDVGGARLDGDTGGALMVEGVIGTTGYRSTTVPTDVSKLDADDLLQGGPALLVGANVAGSGVYVGITATALSIGGL